jgi:FkbM family methyltransferase
MITAPVLPEAWRDLLHRKVAKSATFAADAHFEYRTAEGQSVRFFHNGTPDYLYWCNEYEPTTTSEFCRRARHAKVVLDIGAADGIYAILAASANPYARILAFEPMEEAARSCARNVALNRPVTSNVEVHPIALGDTNAQETLYVSGRFGGSSSLNPRFRSGQRAQPVTVRAGDAFLSEHAVDRVDLVKIDTESTEVSVLRGLSATLRKDKPDIICEVLYQSDPHGYRSLQMREIEQLLRPIGYRFYWISGGGLIEHERLEGERSNRFPNYLFTTTPP